MFGSIDLRRHALGILAVLGCLVWLANSGNTGHRYTIKEVDVPGARELIDGGALVIDVRGKEQFDIRHIPGAVLITIEELRKGIPARLLAESRDKTIVVYCNRGLVHGPEGTAILNQAGFTRAVNLRPGIEGWAEAGQQVRKI